MWRLICFFFQISPRICFWLVSIVFWTATGFFVHLSPPNKSCVKKLILCHSQFDSTGDDTTGDGRVSCCCCCRRVCVVVMRSLRDGRRSEGRGGYSFGAPHTPPAPFFSYILFFFLSPSRVLDVRRECVCMCVWLVGAVCTRFTLARTVERTGSQSQSCSVCYIFKVIYPLWILPWQWQGVRRKHISQ